ncbi:succinate semialdehyde dehydrogenase (plasmid) [Legionella adelaidensis]|uniref:Succinate semialdehyde dehydrogenase n=1 Tax=Legionella adelaidensis TaxID=45056 RepID=A0A0W0R1Y8_9GAMM|nr:NAD-dependent succinate-semialdehyde dehydrogenase [Legionella adelaidensis]KTC65094.1 succinate semialdehyde dehydrogenase [Legionella adelaidensis]VEH85386.1 succinate semialdehyde dehydrogenase [Legionella adelaidensis]
MQIQTINPATEEILQNYPLLTLEQMNAAIDAAHLCYCVWRKTAFSQRTQRMIALANLLRQKKEELAVLIAQEMGKPLKAGVGEIEKCAWVCEHFAHEAENYLAPREIKTEMKKTKVCYQSLGVIFGIMPWNYPFWQVFRFAAPTIMAGNAIILKHAPITTGSGNKIAELFIEAGFPEHLFQHLILDNDLAAKVIAHDKIEAITLTGSERAGSIVAANAASHIKKSVLELGGSDPYIVLEDADIDLAAKTIVTSRLSNTGQVCIAAKRTIVLKSVSEPLLNSIKEVMKNFTVGDPMDANTLLGPMARADLRDNLHKQVQDSIKKGAILLVGGEIPKNVKGYYYPPTLLINVCPGMPAFDEELFGPVIAITEAQDEAQAIRLANQTRFGLSAAIFTRDIAKGEAIATDLIDSGSCFINTYAASDPRVPFGGIKRSGFGRELSREGILEFVNTKVVSIA